MGSEWTTLIRYVGRRVAAGLLVVVGVAVRTFIISRVIPSDPAATWVGGHVPAEVLEQVRQDLGFNRPLREQLWDYLRGLAIGDLALAILVYERALKGDVGRYLPR